jgi:protein deglycase
MARAAVLLAEGFEEIEAITIIDVLRRGEVETKIIGVTGELVAGNHGIAVRCDLRVDQASDGRWDLVALPGGMPGAGTLRDDPRVIAMIRHQSELGGLLGAICAAPIALAKAGVLEGRRATSYPSFKDQLGAVTYAEDDVVIDRGVITSRGPSTALPFALALLEALKGKEARAATAARMLTK